MLTHQQANDATHMLSEYIPLLPPMQTAVKLLLTMSSLYSGSVSCRLQRGVCDGSPLATLGATMNATRPVGSLS